MIEYRGYVARVEFAETADVFHGRVVNSGPYPIATFESTKAGSLRAEFEDLGDGAGWLNAVNAFPVGRSQRNTL